MSPTTLVSLSIDVMSIICALLDDAQSIANLVACGSVPLQQKLFAKGCISHISVPCELLTPPSPTLMHFLRSHYGLEKLSLVNATKFGFDFGQGANSHFTPAYRCLSTVNPTSLTSLEVFANLGLSIGHNHEDKSEVQHLLLRFPRLRDVSLSDTFWKEANLPRSIEQVLHQLPNSLQSFKLDSNRLCVPLIGYPRSLTSLTLLGLRASTLGITGAIPSNQFMANLSAALPNLTELSLNLEEDVNDFSLLPSVTPKEPLHFPSLVKLSLYIPLQSLGAGISGDNMRYLELKTCGEASAKTLLLPPHLTTLHLIKAYKTPLYVDIVSFAQPYLTNSVTELVLDRAELVEGDARRLKLCELDLGRLFPHLESFAIGVEAQVTYPSMPSSLTSFTIGKLTPGETTGLFGSSSDVDCPVLSSDFIFAPTLTYLCLQSVLLPHHISQLPHSLRNLLFYCCSDNDRRAGRLPWSSRDFRRLHQHLPNAVITVVGAASLYPPSDRPEDIQELEQTRTFSLKRFAQSVFPNMRLHDASVHHNGNSGRLTFHPLNTVEEPFVLPASLTDVTLESKNGDQSMFHWFDQISDRVYAHLAPEAIPNMVKNLTAVESFKIIGLEASIKAERLDPVLRSPKLRLLDLSTVELQEFSFASFTTSLTCLRVTHLLAGARICFGNNTAEVQRLRDVDYSDRVVSRAWQGPISMLPISVIPSSLTELDLGPNPVFRDQAREFSRNLHKLAITAAGWLDTDLVDLKQHIPAVSSVAVKGHIEWTWKLLSKDAPLFVLDKEAILQVLQDAIYPIVPSDLLFSMDLQHIPTATKSLMVKSEPFRGFSFGPTAWKIADGTKFIIKSSNRIMTPPLATPVAWPPNLEVFELVAEPSMMMVVTTLPHTLTKLLCLFHESQATLPILSLLPRTLTSATLAVSFQGHTERQFDYTPLGDTLDLPPLLATLRFGQLCFSPKLIPTLPKTLTSLNVYGGSGWTEKRIFGLTEFLPSLHDLSLHMATVTSSLGQQDDITVYDVVDAIEQTMSVLRKRLVGFSMEWNVAGPFEFPDSVTSIIIGKSKKIGDARPVFFRGNSSLLSLVSIHAACPSFPPRLVSFCASLALPPTAIDFQCLPPTLTSLDLLINVGNNSDSPSWADLPRSLRVLGICCSPEVTTTPVIDDLSGIPPQLEIIRLPIVALNEVGAKTLPATVVELEVACLVAATPESLGATHPQLTFRSTVPFLQLHLQHTAPTASMDKAARQALIKAAMGGQPVQPW